MATILPEFFDEPMEFVQRIGIPFVGNTLGISHVRSAKAGAQRDETQTLSNAHEMGINGQHALTQ